MILLLLLTACAAANVPACQVTEWGEWSECQSVKMCEVEEALPLRSYTLPAAQYDQGRFHMQLMIEDKLKQHAERAVCQEEGKCVRAAPTLGYTPCTNGYADIYPCRNVDILSFMDFDDLGYNPPHPTDSLPEGNDIWGWTDPESGDEWAIMGVTGGTSFVKVTDPYTPVAQAFMYTTHKASIWRDMKVIDDVAYIVSEDPNHGMQVFDLRRLRSMTAFEFVEPDYLYTEIGNSHNIVANEETKYLYVVGATQSSYPKNCNGGLHAIDVTNRLEPEYAGCFSADGYTHDAQCVIYHGPDSDYYGKEICFAFNEDTLTIVDVSNKHHMVMISKTAYTGNMYTHQGWLTDDHRVVLLDDELDEYYSINQKQTKTFLWDITSLSNPVLMTRYDSSQTSIDHNQYVKDGFTYQANYQAGLRILSIDEANYNLNEVAYLDVYPSGTKAQFNGAWSVYPYFSSGNVVVSSIDYGLFIVRPDYEAMGNAVTSTYAQRYRTRDIIYTSATCPALEEFQACTAPSC